MSDSRNCASALTGLASQIANATAAAVRRNIADLLPGCCPANGREGTSDLNFRKLNADSHLRPNASLGSKREPSASEYTIFRKCGRRTPRRMERPIVTTG